MLFDSYELIVLFLVGNTAHMFVEVIVYVLGSIACAKSFKEELMIVLLFYFLIYNIALLVRLTCLFLLFGCIFYNCTFFSIREIHFMKTFLLSLLPYFLFLPKNLIAFLATYFQIFIFHDLPILLVLFSKQSSKYIFFDIDLIIVCEQVPVIEVQMIAIKFIKKWVKQFSIT